MIKIKNDVEVNVTPRDLIKSIKLQDQQIDFDINVPDSIYQNLLESFFEREYLNCIDDRTFYYEPKKVPADVKWVQIDRLPIHPNQDESYDLLNRWQCVLSSLHAWNYRLIFLLLRKDGTTKIYLGTASNDPNVTSDLALEQINEAAAASMPGIGLKVLNNEDVGMDILKPLNRFETVGGVTGIPSFKKSSNSSLLQTLDPLAFGIRDSSGEDKDYAMMVISEPIDDASISDIIARYRTLGSKIHSAVKMTGSQTSTLNESKSEFGAVKSGISILGTILGAAVGAMSGIPMGTTVGASVGGSLANGISGLFGLDAQKSGGGSATVNTEFLDKFAQYAEEMTEKNIERLTEGRNLGFWNTGVYVMGNLPNDVVTATGMLRSIYSGDMTYLEPIRLHLFSPNSNADKILSRDFSLLPLLNMDYIKNAEDFKKYRIEEDNWHLLGKEYQYVSTPMNTKELSLATSLPRRDVPGLRFVKTAVRFANNPAVINGEKITIGNVVDTGIIQSNTYDIDLNSLVRHTLVAGGTGSGKSTTCKKILSEVLKNETPIMVIEPAKDDYVRWAIEMNKTLPKEKQFKIYMPGVTEFEGVKIEPLKLNGYAPAYAKGAKVDLLQHSETFATLLNACLPSEDVVPILIEEVVYETIKALGKEENIDIESGETEPLDFYPDIDSMIRIAKKVMDGKDYTGQTKENMKEVIRTRFNSLKRGTRGRILNTENSVDFDEMFGGNVIVNISRLASSKDKALVMSLLMNSLYEYRISKYNNDDEYRKLANANKLLHLCLVEEAHNVLLKPSGNVKSGSPQAAAAELFGNMLSEVRGYGQGFMIVDQVPTRLIDDAMKNTNYKIVHRITAPDDQEVMAKSMAFRNDQKFIIPALEKGNAIICGDEDDAAVWVKIPAPHKNK